MGAVFLTILKIIGIVLLCLLGLILLLACVLLFVPVRYQIRAQKDARDELKASRVTIRVTWLLHFLNVCFAYPERTYVRVRLLFFTIFRSDRPKKKKKQSKVTHKTEQKKQQKPDQQSTPDVQNAQKERHGPEASGDQKVLDKPGESYEVMHGPPAGKGTATQEEKTAPPDAVAAEKRSFKERFLRIVSKVWEILKNIRYTIRKIYDKIMDVINNIRYYTELLRSELFKETFRKCSGELLKLLKSIAPRKIKGWLRIGMEDPATTGKLMGYYGMLYPLIGDHITIVPDFDQVILEGNILIKGKITLFQAIKTGIIVYFNKDLRKLIQLWKREGT